MTIRHESTVQTTVHSVKCTVYTQCTVVDMEYGSIVLYTGIDSFVQVPVSGIVLVRMIRIPDTGPVSITDFSNETIGIVHAFGTMMLLL
jgi:hypothetical protein